VPERSATSGERSCEPLHPAGKPSAGHSGQADCERPESVPAGGYDRWMKKELRPLDDLMACDVCGRTILKGERTHAFLAPGGQRHSVCELCMPRAEHEGWIRESAHADLPVASRRAEPRRSLLGRLRRRREEEVLAPTLNGGSENGEQPVADEPQEQGAGSAWEPEAYAAPAPGGTRLREAIAGRPRDPRHVRAVPTNAQAKVERALELFNASHHSRTVAGLTRTLGAPFVRAAPDAAAPSEVAVVVAWELSWYHYRIDLGDAQEAIVLVAKGTELGELDEALREWNGSATPDGLLQGS